MNKKIAWRSGILDEISLVYDKAEENEAIGKKLESLEEQALLEAETVTALFTEFGRSGKNFANLSPSEKEMIIASFGGQGLSELKIDIASATISVTFASIIPLVQACTIFNLLNRLEKLDGGFNVLVSEKTTLLLRLPLGGKEGMFQWEFLIMQLYPWLSIKEESTNEIAKKKTSSPSSGGTASSTVAPGTETNHRTTGSQKGILPEELYQRMSGKLAFTKALDKAKNEIETVIRNRIVSLEVEGEPLTVEKWRQFPEKTQLTLILAVANRGVKVRSTIYVDLCDEIPYCNALALLAAAESGQIEKQLIDVGGSKDAKSFVEALTLLHSCCDRWEYTITNPAYAKIASGNPPIASEDMQSVKKSTEPAKLEKKSLWKRLFGK